MTEGSQGRSDDSLFRVHRRASDGVNQPLGPYILGVWVPETCGDGGGEGSGGRGGEGMEGGGWRRVSERRRSKIEE